MIINPVPKQKGVVRLKNTSGILSQSASSGTTVKSTVLVPATSTTRFDQLTDVTELTPTSGAVPQYNADTDTYEVKPLEFPQVFDGGTF